MVPTDKRTSYNERLWEISTPIFTPDMGLRLKIARMKLKWSQAELGERLGVSQQQIGRIEAGRRQTIENPFSSAVLRDALRTHINYVLFGSNADLYDYVKIKAAYWEVRDATKGNRTHTGGHKHHQTIGRRNDAH